MLLLLLFSIMVLVLMMECSSHLKANSCNACPFAEPVQCSVDEGEDGQEGHDVDRYVGHQLDGGWGTAAGGFNQVLFWPEWMKKRITFYKLVCDMNENTKNVNWHPHVVLQPIS